MTTKRCACCTRTYTAEQFHELPYVGEMEELTLRNCPCGSTIAMVNVRARSIESRPPCPLYAGPLTVRGVL